MTRVNKQPASNLSAIDRRALKHPRALAPTSIPVQHLTVPANSKQRMLAYNPVFSRPMPMPAPPVRLPKKDGTSKSPSPPQRTGVTPQPVQSRLSVSPNPPGSTVTQAVPQDPRTQIPGKLSRESTPVAENRGRSSGAASEARTAQPSQLPNRASSSTRADIGLGKGKAAVLRQPSPPVVPLSRETSETPAAADVEKPRVTQVFNFIDDISSLADKTKGEVRVTRNEKASPYWAIIRKPVKKRDVGRYSYSWKCTHKDCPKSNGCKVDAVSHASIHLGVEHQGYRGPNKNICVHCKTDVSSLCKSSSKTPAKKAMDRSRGLHKGACPAITEPVESAARAARPPFWTQD